MGFYVAAQVVKLMAQKGIAGSRILVMAHDQIKAMVKAVKVLDLKLAEGDWTAELLNW